MRRRQKSKRVGAPAFVEPTLHERRAITEEVLTRLRAAGFALVGICDARPSERGDQFRDWIGAGKHGEMGYMAEHVDERLDPGRMIPGARSIICVADRYHDGRGDARSGPSRGRIARYARGADYHAVMRSRIEPLSKEWRTRLRPHRFRVCVDTAPIMEREHAARAGLGRIGKHTLLIGEGVGSWLLLGEIVTTYPLIATPAASAPDSPDPCGTCTQCIDACPTRAITPWSVDATRCLSYLTIEHKGEIDAGLAKLRGAGGSALADHDSDWLFGCDICQEVCPHNQPTRRSRRAGARAEYSPLHRDFDLLDVLGWTEADRSAANLSAVLRRASLSMWKRNARTLLHGSAQRGGAEDPGSGSTTTAVP